MKLYSRFLLAVPLAVFALSALHAENGTLQASRWEHLIYNSRFDHGWKPDVPEFVLSTAEQGLQLSVIGPSHEFFQTHHLEARVYRGNGIVVELTPNEQKNLNMPGGIRTASRADDEYTWESNVFFPWGPNTLDESWLEVSTDTDRYWIEIPYGFDRDPQAPLSPAKPDGPPHFAAAMAHMDSHDHIIPWQTVDYGLEIQEGWQLELTQSNASTPESQVEIHCPPMELNQPSVPLRVLDLAGNSIGDSIRIYPPLRYPSDRGSAFYQLGVPNADERSWGQIEITVKDKPHCFVVPSSLFIEAHGHAATD
jgi:hypothetical protein